MNEEASMYWRYLVGFVFVMMMILAANLLATALGVMSAVVTAWMLLSMTTLTSSQALLIGGVGSCFFLYVTRRNLRLTWYMTFMFTFMGASMFSMIWVLIASLVANYTPFEFWHALLLSTAIGLAFLYSIITDFEQEAQVIMSRLRKRGLKEEGVDDTGFASTSDEYNDVDYLSN